MTVLILFTLERMNMKDTKSRCFGEAGFRNIV